MSFKPAYAFLGAVCVTLTGFCSVGAHADVTESEARKDALREQVIYIPYDKLRRTFERQGRGVFLPYEQFQELWKAARDKQPQPRDMAPPVNAVITEIANEARVENDVVRVVAVVKIEVLGDGWIEVPLRLSDVALLSATIDGSPARLVADQHAGHKLLLKIEEDDPRQVELRLEYAKSISKKPGQNSVAFQAPLAPVNRWRIRIPEAGVKVNVHPMLAVTEVPTDRVSHVGEGLIHPREVEGVAGSEEEQPRRPDGAGPETVVLAFVGAAPIVRIDWTPKAEGASGLDALISVQTEQEVTIDEGVTRTRVRLAYEVSRAELSQLRIEVPAEQKVVNVVDPNVRQWNVEANGNTQTITVGLFQSTRSQQTVSIELEKFNDQTDEERLVPIVKAVDVGRQRGVVVVRLADGLRAEPIRRAGLLQLDSSDVPAHLKRRPWTFAYRYAALPFDLALRVEKIEPRIHVDQLVEAFLEPQMLTLDLFAKYTIERAGVFELQLDVPAGLQLRRVRGHKAAGAKAAVVDSYVLEETENGRARLTINLASKALGSVGLLVEMEAPLDDANLLSPTGQSSQIDVSPIHVAEDSVQRTTGRLVVYAPESLRVAIEQLDNLRSISFEEAFQDLASMRAGRFGDLRPVQAFSFSDAAASAQLTAQRRQPQVTVQQLLVARIDPGVVKYEATFFFDIRYSGVKSLRIDVPADLAGRVRNETKSLRETVMTPPPSDLAEGYVAWSFAGETELLGQSQCKLTWETAIDELDIGKSVELAVPRLIPNDVDRADGQIVLVKAETIDVQPKGQPSGLEPIDPQHDLMKGVRVADAAVALQFHDAWELTLLATRYQLEVLKHTSIEQAVLRMVITRSERVSVQALYRMRSSRQRLEIQLPDEVAPGKIEFDTHPLRINGRRVTLERGDDTKTYFVPLVGVQSNEPFVLELRYTAAGSGERLAYPVFPDEPAMQKVHLLAYIPQELTYLGKRGPWTDETVWRYDGRLQRVPTPRVPVDRLINRLIQDINITGNPVEDFPQDGRPLLFSTLRPGSPEVGALHLTTFSSQLLHGLVFGFFGLAGVLLLRRPASDRIVVACLLLATLVLAGVFLPTLINAILNHVFVLAVAVVGLLWLAAFSVRTLPMLAQLRWSWPRRRRQSAAVATQPDASPPAEQSSPPHPDAPEPPPGKEGGEDNA